MLLKSSHLSPLSKFSLCC